LRRAASSFAGTVATTDRTVLNAHFGADVDYVVTLEGIPGSIRVDGARQGTLRVTHVFQREADRWLIVHRHADPLIDKAGAGGQPT
jgi:ketosteroid isomerase-like protein